MKPSSKFTYSPFSKRVDLQLSRRVFAKGLFAAGIAAVSMPVVQASIARPAPQGPLPVRGALRAAIDAQLQAYNGQMSLADAADDNGFHTFLVPQLDALHPATTV